MSDLVLDASVAMALVIKEKSSAKAQHALDRVKAGGSLWVPALWWFEVGNVLAMAVRRKRLSGAEASRCIALLQRLPLKTDSLLGPEGMRRWRALAKEHGLIVYDAAYLEIAQRRGLALASFDEGLRKASRDSGVDLAC